ncbi:MAG: tryptophan synthase subunit alpha [Verrucomicrobiota bacterium]|nr:tryptophan synthase subunit alpha [Verrucomicrobiota bacterium]
MNRITQKFDELRQAGRKGLVGYLTAGDPDPGASEKNIRTAIENGLDVLELGVPFSDPTADGPTIQAASHRALRAGMTLGKSLELVRRLRRDTAAPIVLFGYANPFFRRGYARAAEEAAAAGADGLLVVDLPFEEKDELCPHLDRNGLFFIPLVAPTTSAARATKLLARAQGFVYYIMVRGVTGARERLAADLAAQVGLLRRCATLPIAVGFGIQRGEQARAAAQVADAVVVGSALVEAAQKGTLATLVRELRRALG